MTQFEEIEEAREALSLKAKEVENYLGLPQGQYSAWKHGKRPVSKAAILALRAAASLPFEEPPAPTFKGFQRVNGERNTKVQYCPTRKPNERAEAMRLLYIDGQTLHDIGQKFGVTRERVRQILTRDFGITAPDGGKRLAVTQRLASVREAQETRMMQKHGCTVAQYQRLVAVGRKMMEAGAGQYQTPIFAFVSQKRNAGERGIAWEFKLWDWWSVWQASGKWDRRGRGGFVMARFGDKGPYSKDNVKIITNAENASEANNKSGLPIGVVKLSSGKYAASKGRKRLGIFDTAEVAHLAYLKANSKPEQVAA